MAHKSGMVLRSRFGHNRTGFEGMAKIVKAEQKKQFNVLAPQIIAAYQTRVFNWSDNSKPQFVRVIVLGAEGKPISMFIQTRGTDHQRNTFELIDSEGRPGGVTIPAQLGRPMKFRKNYFAKTAATDIYGRSSRRTGPWVTTYEVTQGPVTPRGFSEAIMNEFKPRFMLAARRGWRAAASKITGRPQREF